MISLITETSKTVIRDDAPLSMALGDITFFLLNRSDVREVDGEAEIVAEPQVLLNVNTA